MIQPHQPVHDPASRQANGSCHELRVTRVEVFPAARADGPYRASATIVLNHGWKVYGLAVIRRKAGLAVVMPQFERRDGSRVDSSHPLSAEVRSEVVGAVLEACKQMGMQ